jgi:small-conductance mechanosensitive channel
VPAARPVLPAVRWLALVVPLADVVLVLTGVLSLRTGIVVALVLEVLLAVVLVVEAAAFRRAYGAARRDGGSRRAGLVAGTEAVWPPAVLRLVRAEAGVVRALWWAVRRRSDVGPGDVPLQVDPVARVAFWGDEPQAVVRLLRDRAVPAGR